MGDTRPRHKIVPNGTLGLNLETEDRLTRQVHEYLRKGTLPESFLKKRGMKSKPETFSEFLKVNFYGAIKRYLNRFSG